MKTTAAAILVLLLTTGCVPRITPATPTPDEPKRAQVEWDDYAPDLKTTIDQLEADQDCTALQDQFDTADANSAATKNRTGHNNARLMKYIHEALNLAGCYD